MVETEAAPRHRYVAQRTRWRDLAAVWAFENEVFGDDNVSFDTLRRWWWRYSGMALHVRDAAGQVVGTFDASPLERHAFERILEGRWTEADLTADSIQRSGRGTVAAYWCLTSLVTRAGCDRRAEVLGALLSGVAERLRVLPEVSWPSAWCAVAQSREGERILERGGFHRYHAGSPPRRPRFLLRLHSAEDLRAFIASVTDAASILAQRQARRLQPALTDVRMPSSAAADHQRIADHAAA